MSAGRTAGIYDFDNIRANVERIRKEENVINSGGPNNEGTISSNGIDTTIKPDEPASDYPPAYY